MEEGSFRYALGIRSLSKEPFDLEYLQHATGEVLLGLMFAGRVPIVRGYLGNLFRTSGDEALSVRALCG
jgi:hypothetical protein